MPSLFDLLAREYEQQQGRRPPWGRVSRLSWSLSEPRPIFPLSAVGWLARDDRKPDQQKMVLADVGNGQEWGGFIYPSRFRNASYAFGSQKQVDNDINEVCKKTKIRRPTAHALEFELQLAYRCRSDGLSAQLKGAKVKPLIRPVFSPALPLPSEKNEWRCIASGTTRQALIGLSAALASAEVPLVLITGPPGSGKEAYAAALHYGRSENWNEDQSCASSQARDRIKRLSLAEVNVDALDRWLTDLLPGLSGDGGTVFLDEADKPDKAVRAHLLRLLEERRYQPRGTRRVIECGKIAFVIAAGEPLNKLREKDPPDFWTRMEIHIEVGDPLMAPTSEERENLIAAFFRHFWWDAVSRWLEGVLGATGHPDLACWLNRSPQAKDFAQKVFQVAVGDPARLLQDNIEAIQDRPAFELSWSFARVLAPHLERRQLSLRGLRSAVKSVAWELGSGLLAMALAPTNEDENVRRSFREQASKAVARAIGTVLQVVPG